MLIRHVRHGSVLTLSIAVLAATAVWGLVNGFVNSIVMPFVANALDQRNSFDLMFRLGDTDYPYGFVLAQAISFLISAGLIYLIIRRVADETQDCPFCLSVIPIDAFACAYCTREIPEMGDNGEGPDTAIE